MNEDLNGKLMNSFKGIAMLSLIFFCGILVTKSCIDNYEYVDDRKEFRKKIKDLKFKSDSLSSKVIVLQKEVEERDKKIDVFLSKISGDDKIFKNFKSSNDAKIKYLNTISSDSLSLFLSSVRFYPNK